MNPSVVCSVGSFFHGRPLGRRTGSEHSSGQSSAQSVGYAKDLGRQHDYVRGKSKEMRSFQRVMACVSALKRHNCRKHQSSRPQKLRRSGAGAVSPAQLINPFGILYTILVLVGMNIRFGLNSTKCGTSRLR